VLRQDGILLEIQKVAEKCDRDNDSILTRDEIEEAERLLGINLMDSMGMDDDFYNEEEKGVEEDKEGEVEKEWVTPDHMKRMEFEMRAADCRDLDRRSISDFRRSIISVFRLFDHEGTGLAPLSLVRHLLTETLSPTTMNQQEFEEFLFYAGLEPKNQGKLDEDNIMINYEELIGTLLVGVKHDPLVTPESVPFMK